jgi:hypothetical protein
MAIPEPRRSKPAPGSSPSFIEILSPGPGPTYGDSPGRASPVPTRQPDAQGIQRSIGSLPSVPGWIARRNPVPNAASREGNARSVGCLEGLVGAADRPVGWPPRRVGPPPLPVQSSAPGIRAGRRRRGCRPPRRGGRAPASPHPRDPHRPGDRAPRRPRPLPAGRRVLFLPRHRDCRNLSEGGRAQFCSAALSPARAWPIPPG